ncbi:MAG: hypothetical protein Q8P50_15550 [Bacillota bacterium]|nr:hypothetical protein [Bacillota bacterium]
MNLAMNKVLSLLFLIVSGAVILRQISLVKRGGPLPTIRKIAALEAISEVVGRATEMGRPVHFTSGVGKIDDEFAPQTMAATEILSNLARLCAEYGAKLLVSVCPTLVFPVQQDAVRHGYALAGKIDEYSEDQVRFLSDQQMAYASAAVAIIQREKAAANIMIGAFYGEFLLIAEAGLQSGAIQIGGTARMYQLPFAAVIFDYLLIGEEMFAGGAYITKDRAKLGAIQGQDYVKVGIICATLVGAVFALMGSKALVNLLVKYGN